nr:unnamed protein product [Spirometra erinaceieuropaei]
MGENGPNLLQQKVTERAREQRATRDAALVNKFHKTAGSNVIQRRHTGTQPVVKDLAVETIERLRREIYDETENRLGHVRVIQLLEFCLKTYFTFDGTTYEQVKGTPMSSQISGLIAVAVLQRMESLVFRHHRPKFWARYVDDAFAVIEQPFC